MKQLTILFTIGFFIIFSGCSANETNDINDATFTRIDSNQKVEQNVSNQVKKMLAKNDKITDVYAVNTDNTLITTFDVKHRYRFQLKSLTSKVKNKLQQIFPKHDITVSTDQKIILELKNLEQQLTKDNLKKENIIQKVKKIKKLSEEET